jgi:hypothetical protein
MRRSWLRLLCVLLVGTLVAAACGSDRDDDSADSGGGTTETTAAGGDDGDDDDDGELTFGDLESPCGEGDGGTGDEQGISDSKILIGYGDDAGFSGSPGLNHHQSDAIKALIDWCNEQGGINGWEIEGKYYDAKITEVNNAMLAACDEVFMLVGQGWALDAGQEETRVGCDLPSFPTFSVSPGFAHGPKMLQGVPNPVDFTPAHIADAMTDLFPEETKKAATMVANYSATLDTRAKVLSAYPDFGFEFLDCNVEYNIAGESDWRPFAQRLKDCGAEFVYFAGSPFPNFQNFLEAANQLDFNPIYQVDANFYEEQFVEWNSNGYADNVYLRFAFNPFEDRDEVKAVDDYLNLLDESGGDVSLLGMQATSSFLLWATAVKACGAEVTRQCVLDEGLKIEEWTAGGLHAPTHPAENKPPDCGIVLKLEGTEFKRVRPEAPGEFECDPSYVAAVEGPVVDQAKLDENRVSTLFSAG